MSASSNRTPNAASRKPPLVKSSAIFFGLTNLAAVTIVPYWGIVHGYSAAAWIAAAVLLTLGGMSITTGYHRLWSHRTFKAAWPVRLVLALFGGMALQNSIYVWAARHRIHHRHVDDVERDPHSIKTSFWHAHIGWMLRHWPTSEVDFSQVRDLEKDPIVMWQHRYYWPLVWTTNLGIPLLLGWITGDWIGMLLLAGVLRLVASHHFTFFINSLAHTWGRRPYSEDNTAVDNGAIALLTWGEGYHNYHHAFQADYRNGIRWWQYDPSKWLINVLAWCGLVRDRKRVPNFRIRRARLMLEFTRLQRRIEQGAPATWRERLDQELGQFRDTIGQWQVVQRRRVEAGADALKDRWARTEMRTRIKELEYRLKMQQKRLRALTQSLEPQAA
ncbi:acyl-CoA desaturase [Wenzhouxiangella sp. XN79A]|uniref:acyl-CoA desaturase n=1 Tax=Wenzhouxiangella sp. XN79A TaxID=2724193 RepID=UPI00144ACE84|nr:fatty acid desaturase [Wenzhouxiangella sp. XN79A]NKI35261.1 acyl-CoA desaturase [Wenzhouxiangella sp. XN79A]